VMVTLLNQYLTYMFDIVSQADDANWMTMRHKSVICIKYCYVEFFLPGTMIVA